MIKKIIIGIIIFSLFSSFVENRKTESNGFERETKKDVLVDIIKDKASSFTAKIGNEDFVEQTKELVEDAFSTGKEILYNFINIPMKESLDNLKQTF